MKREARCTNCEHIGTYEGKLNQLAKCAECGGLFEMARDNSRILYGWRIVRDYTEPAGSADSISGKTYRDYQGGKYRYQLKDDDGDTYYIIESDIDPETGTETQLFAPLEWATYYAGCTSIAYRDEKTGGYIPL